MKVYLDVSHSMLTTEIRVAQGREKGMGFWRRPIQDVHAWWVGKGRGKAMNKDNCKSKNRKEQRSA